MSKCAKIVTLLAVTLCLAACETTQDPAPGSSSSSSGGSSGSNSSGSSSSSSGTTPAATCATTNLGAGVGIEQCFSCMQEKCCAELKACDGDEDCVYCLANLTDSTSRCVDGSNGFGPYPKRAALDKCQTSKCTPPCGTGSAGSCVVGDCPPTCAGYANGCKN